MQNQQHSASGGGTITDMQKDDTYKYLRFAKSQGIQEGEVKQQLKEKLKRRTLKLLNTKLSAQNMTSAKNAYAVPAAAYSFGVIKWTETELEDLNRTIRV